MARGRLISRTLGSSRKFAALAKDAGKLGEFAQTLYPILVACSDDFGRMAGDAFTVQLTVFPSSPRTERDFGVVLQAMHRVGLIFLYDVEGDQVLQIIDFDDHQPGLHKRTKSKFPEPAGKFPAIPSEEKRREENRTEGNVPPTSPTALARRGTDPLPEGFSDFWTNYPKKKSRADAEKAWRKLAPSPELTQRIVAAVAAQRGSFDWQRESGRYIPHPATWLNAQRWEDDYQRSKTTGKWTTDSVCACWVIWRKQPAPQFIRYAPESVLAELEAETPAYRRHMDDLMAEYRRTA